MRERDHDGGEARPATAKLRSLLLALLALAAALAAPASVASAAGRAPTGASASFIAIGGIARVPKGAVREGALVSQKRLSFGIALKPRDAAALERYAAGVSAPGSASYHRYLTPTDFASRFGPDPASIARLVAGLRAEHLRVGRISANHLVVPVSGTVADIEGAFRTELEGYKLASGRHGWAALRAPMLKSDLASAVAAVIGLNDLAVPHSFLRRAPRTATRHGVSPRRAETPLATIAGAPSACTAASNDALASGGWSDDDVANAYGLNGLFAKGDLGSGETIGVFELEPFSMSDLKTFDTCYFGSDRTSQVTTDEIDGFNETGTGSGEAILDVETLAVLAPDANLVVYEAPNTTFGAIDEYNAMVSGDRANVISTSWGECEQAIETGAPGAQQVENYLFEEAAAQGQTVFSAAGDTGSDDCASTQFGSSDPVTPYDSVDDPASQPFVVGAGGTSLTSDEAPLSATDEMVWNDGAQWGGGGGGVSSTWTSPAWQEDSGVAGVATSGGRQVPDVSASADEWRGITVYSSQFAPTSASATPTINVPAGWVTIGGTSGAAPIWAAVVADIAASGSTGTSCAQLSATAGGADLGFVAPELYEVAASSYAEAFHDVTIGSNDVFGLGTGYSAGPGYDLASGLGSPVVTGPNGSAGLADALCGVATSSAQGAPACPVITSLSPSFGPTSGGNNVSIALSSAPPAGASVAVQFGSTPATVESVSGTTVIVSAPVPTLSSGSETFAGAGPAELTVIVSSGGQSAASLPGASTVYDYVNENSSLQVTPTVTGVGPFGGNDAGGNTVTIYGSGFATGTDTVSFGGVDSSDVNVVSDYELTALVPAQSASTSCETGRGFDPSSDCQSEVVVSNANGASETSTILPALSGYIVFSPQGIIDPTPETEVGPAATEYDYSPTPVITSMTPNPGDATGEIAETITGTGFNLDNFEWVNFGPTSDPSSEQVDLAYISSTSIVIAPPAEPGTLTTATSPLQGGVSVQTTGGLSNSVAFTYAGLPLVEHLSSYGGPASGGTALTITGVGLSGVNEVAFVDELAPSLYGASIATNISNESATSLTVVTPADLPGPVDVVPCTPSACAKSDPANDTFVYYSLAKASLSAFTPKSGPASGGTAVTLFGDNLNGLSSVNFGTSTTSAITPAGGYPDGDPYVASVKSPPGKAKSSVHLSVRTRSGASAELSSPSFTFEVSAPSAPRSASAEVRKGDATITWVAPKSTGGSKVTGYTLVASAPSLAPLVRHVKTRSRQVRIDDLPAGHRFSFRVAAVNKHKGRGPWTSPVTRTVGYASNGYRTVSASGHVTGFGSLPSFGDAPVTSSTGPVVAAAGTANGSGYWVVTRNGTVFSFGGAAREMGVHPESPVVAIVSSPRGGYWLATRAGNVFSFGGAGRYGSLTTRHDRPTSPIVAMVGGSRGDGYRLIAADGTVYRFGSAGKGSERIDLGGAKAVAATSTTSGKGFWVLTSSGGIVASGDAHHFASIDRGLSSPVSIATSGDGRGYVVVTSSGHLVTTGDEVRVGGVVGRPGRIVAVATI